MSAPVQWLAGDEKLRAIVEAAIDGGPGEAVIAESARRRVLRIEPAEPTGTVAPLALKHFRVRTQGRAANAADDVKRSLGRSAAAREWRALVVLENHALPAPTPRAHARRGDEEWLAMDFVAGRPLAELLRSLEAADRRALVGELGSILRRLRSAGIAHGDLHLGNVLFGAAGEPVLVDWQRARLTRSPRAHARDLAALEFSFARSGLARSDRVRLRRAALGTTSRASLLAAGARTDAFAHDHYRGRTRRSRHEGSGQTLVDAALGPGMRRRDFGDDALREARRAHAAAFEFTESAESVESESPDVLKNDERARVTRLQIAGHAVVAKEVLKGGAGRRLADPLRGSPAERGWVGGHGLLARRIGSTQPLAWLARGGSRGGSILFMTDVTSRGCLETAVLGATRPDVLLRLLLALHRRGVDHGDLQASHVYGVETGAPVLIDLEGVRFRRRLGDDARLRALAELNASLPEAALESEARRELFERYAAALPFKMPRDQALREVVRRSLARAHLWANDPTGS